MTFNLFIIDTAVKLCPEDWLKHEIVRKYKIKYNRMPLIDSNKHQKLLKYIPRENRMDRPDILHFGLLTALGYAKLIDMNIFFNLNENLYHINSETRIPRSQKRFYGLIEVILSDKYKGKHINKVSWDILKNHNTAAITRQGKTIINENIPKNLVFGGFAFGSFKRKFKTDFEMSLSNKPLELWTAISITSNRLFPD